MTLDGKIESRNLRPARAVARPILLVGLVILVAGLGLWLGISFLKGPAPDQNLIIVLVDTLRRDALGCYGNRFDLSPRIDALAAEGVRFDQAVSTSGWTLPAVASLLTGTWPSIHGARGKVVHLSPIRDEVPTAAEIFREQGFRTLALANAAFVSPLLHLDRGFEVYDHRHAYNSDIRRADETVATALDLLAEHGPTGVFLLIHLFDPHVDYDPPAGWETRFTGGRAEPPPPLTHEAALGLRADGGASPPPEEDLRYIEGLYYGEVGFVDAQVGRLIARLQEMGVYDRTTLVVTSDHGEEFWEHGGFEHGHTLYDELILIPLVVKFPAGVPRVKQEVAAQVRILDVLPTLFALAGIEQPASFVGQSLLPYVSGEANADLVAFSEGTLYGSEKVAWRTGNYKYILNLTTDGEQFGELYDWRVDPGELEDLVAARPQIATGLHQELASFFNEIKAQGDRMSQPRVENLSPQVIESLRSLGYIR